jgi:hypothetical protein
MDNALSLWRRNIIYMEITPLTQNPFAALTFIAAPALRLRKPIPRHAALTGQYPRGSVAYSRATRAIKESGGDQWLTLVK